MEPVTECYGRQDCVSGCALDRLGSCWPAAGQPGPFALLASRRAPPRTRSGRAPGTRRIRPDVMRSALRRARRLGGQTRPAVFSVRPRLRGSPPCEEGSISICLLHLVPGAGRRLEGSPPPPPCRPPCRLPQVQQQPATFRCAIRPDRRVRDLRHHHHHHHPCSPAAGQRFARPSFCFLFFFLFFFGFRRDADFRRPDTN